MSYYPPPGQQGGYPPYQGRKNNLVHFEFNAQSPLPLAAELTIAIQKNPLSPVTASTPHHQTLHIRHSSHTANLHQCRTRDTRLQEATRLSRVATELLHRRAVMVLHLRSRATASPHMANSRPHKGIPHSSLMTPLRQASMAFLHLSRVIELLL